MEASAQVTSVTIMEMRIDNENGANNDDNYGVIQERLSVNAGVGDVSTWARLDADIFLNKPTDQFEQNLRAERLGVAWRLGNFTLQGGDFFQQLGRGIALNLRKLTGAGVDVSLQGAKVAYLGDTHGFSIFGGRPNPANIDPVNQRFVEDPQDAMAGATYEVRPFASTRFGAYALGLVPGERLVDDFADFTTTGGAWTDLPSLLSWLTLYAELVGQYRQLAGQHQFGYAAYLNSEARVGDFGLLTEAMAINGFEQSGSQNSALGNRFDYNQPPTLERIDQEVVNNSDLVGIRFRGEYFIPDLLLLVYANAMARWNFPGESNQFYQVHGFTGFEWTFPGGTGRLNVSVGARDETEGLPDSLATFSFDDKVRQPIRSMAHLDIDWLQPLPFWGLSLHTTTMSQFWLVQGVKRFDRGSTFLGVEKAGVGGVTFEFGYDTQNQGPDIRNFFYALIGAWEAEDWLTFRGTVGTQRGGIKCIAGVCREFPAFAGARAQMIARF